MTQILSSSNKLTPKQCEICINNFAKIRHFKNVDLIFDGKPEFDKANKEEMKKLGIDPLPITKFATNYKIYKLSNVEQESDSIKLIRTYNNEAKFKNLNERIEIIIIVDTDKIDKQNYLALQGLYPKIHNLLKENKDYKMLGGIDEETEDTEDTEDTEKKKASYEFYKYSNGPCYVTIFTTNHIAPNMVKHFHTRFIPCNYRVLSLYDDVYPLLGSKNKIWTGLTSNFEVMEYERLYNNYEYSIIYDDEHIVKLLNANPGDLIIGTQIINEGRPYMEFIIKEVKARKIETDED